jgi:hypothetical protein
MQCMVVIISLLAAGICCAKAIGAATFGRSIGQQEHFACQGDNCNQQYNLESFCATAACSLDKGLQGECARSSSFNQQSQARLGKGGNLSQEGAGVRMGGRAAGRSWFEELGFSGDMGYKPTKRPADVAEAFRPASRSARNRLVSHSNENWIRAPPFLVAAQVFQLHVYEPLR